MLTEVREMGVDFGKTAFDYARYRVGFPDRFFDRQFETKVVSKGDRVLDLGTATGTVARGLAQRGSLLPDSILRFRSSNRPRI